MQVENEFVRPARSDDAASVSSLLNSERLEAEFVPKEFVVVEVSGRIVGCARAKPVPEGGTEFSSLAVHKEYRGRGLSRALFEMALLGARHPVYALTLVPELASRAGFESVESSQLPRSLQGKASACNVNGRPWKPMRLRRKPVADLPPLEPQGEPDFLET